MGCTCSSREYRCACSCSIALPTRYRCPYSYQYFHRRQLTHTHTFTATDKTQSLTFTITGGAGGSYQGDSYQGFGGAGAYITGTIDLTEGDTVTFITAGGGGPYSGSAEAPGRGWADGGSHEAAYIGTNSYTNAFQEGPGRITELYGPTGGGASAVLLNGTPIAIAGGGGGGGARQISRTTWSKIYGERPSGFKGLRFNHGNIANGGTGGPSYTGGEGYDETYEYFPGPSLHMNGGKGGYNGWAGAGGEAGNLLNPHQQLFAFLQEQFHVLHIPAELGRQCR